jgi:hypothetical protein
MKRTLLVVFALSLAGSLAACGGDDPKADSTPTAPTSVPSSPTPTSAGGGPPTDWESKFTASELAAGRKALARWTSWRQLSSEIYKNGVLTPGAKATLQDYDFWWQRDLVTLGETYENGGLRREGDVEALWSYVKSIRIDNDGTTGQVVIVECTDYRPLRYTRNGEPQKVNKPRNPVTPLLITMTKPDAQHDWMYYRTDLKDERSCAAA